ncbi:hypothetical protein EC957_005493 [Mortierella hygrophila]|uniref:Uncharacterized protein n=1 Tax=Mortierella hygrophila TaxID=979708 RepID=A0A9P6K652_9FUNG|nr:hypothetical protein EC957_005493 [Mortierella hygrophila]
MWQEEVSLTDTNKTALRYHSEPLSPEPDSPSSRHHSFSLNEQAATPPQLPSSTLPETFSARPAYTIGTKSHSYATEHRKTIPFPIPTTPSSSSPSSSSALASPAATESSSSAILDMDPDNTSTPQQLIDLGDINDNTNTNTNNNTSDLATSPVSPPATPSSKRTSLSRAPSLQRTNSTTSNTSNGNSRRIDSTVAALASFSSPPTGPASNGGLVRPSSLSLSLSRNSSLSKKTGSKQQQQLQQQQQQQQDCVPPSLSSTHRPQKHVMLHRQSTSQDFQLRLHQQQQRQDDMGEELSEAGEEQIPGTPTSISSFGSGTMGMSSSDREREKSASIRQKRQSRSFALIENRNIQTLSSNLAMVASPTDSEFPAQPTSDSLLSVIAQKEARIALLREDLETNLTELTQLKERWSQMMMEERTRQQAEASASIQEQEKNHYGHSSQSVSHRLSTTGAGIWGSVVGSVSGISGVSGGISLHHINTLHSQQHQQQQPIQSPQLSSQSANGLVSGRSSTSSAAGRGGESSTSGAGFTSPSGNSRPTSPLPTYLSSLNGLNSPVSPNGLGGTNLSSALLAKRGDRASFSSLSTCSSSQSNAGDAPLAFEAGHSSQSSFSSSTGHPEYNQRDQQQRDARKLKRESSGLFIPPEAEEVLVNTGRALFKGFGSLLGGIRTVVTDVTESDRQRTMDMMSGLAQTAADVLPLPSHDDIYYHHQRLRLLDEEDEEPLTAEQQQQLIQLQQAKEQRRKERLRLKQEKERRLLEKGQSGSGSESGLNRSGSLVRRSSSRKVAKGVEKITTEKQQADEDVSSSSKTIQQLSIRDEEEEGQGWDMEDKDLMASLEADVRGQAAVQDDMKMNSVDFENTSRIHAENESLRDTPSTTTTTTTTATFAPSSSKKND